MKVEPNTLIIEGTYENGNLITCMSKVQYANGEIYEGRITH